MTFELRDAFSTSRLEGGESIFTLHSVERWMRKTAIQEKRNQVHAIHLIV